MPILIAWALFVIFVLFAQLLLAGLDWLLGTWPLSPPALSWALHGFVIGFLLRLAAAHPELVPDPGFRVIAFALIPAWGLIMGLAAGMYFSQ